MNSRLRQLLIGAVAVALVMSGMALSRTWSQQPAEMLKTTGLFLVDKDGNNRGWFGLTGEGTCTLALLRADGDPRLSLNVTSDGIPSVSLFGAAPTSRATLRLDDQGNVGLTLASPDGKDRLKLGVAGDTPGLGLLDESGSVLGSFGIQDGACLLGFTTAEGDVRLAVGTDAEGLPSVSLYGEADSLRAELAVGADGNTRLSMHNREGEGGLVLGLIPNLGPALSFHDKDGKTRLSAVLNEQAGPGMSMQDQDGSETWSAP